MSRSRRRRRHVLVLFVPLVVAAAVAGAVVARGGGVLAVRTTADSASPLSASYQAVTNWGDGYTGQYTITNGGTADVSGWTLAFRLPSGTSLSSLWNGSATVSGGQVTVTNDGWDATVAAGGSVTVGFVTSATGQAGAPTDCTIDGVACQAGGSGAATSPAATASPTPSAQRLPVGLRVAHPQRLAVPRHIEFAVGLQCRVRPLR